MERERKRIECSPEKRKGVVGTAGEEEGAAFVATKNRCKRVGRPKFPLCSSILAFLVLLTGCASVYFREAGEPTGTVAVLPFCVALSELLDGRWESLRGW